MKWNYNCLPHFTKYETKFKLPALVFTIPETKWTLFVKVINQTKTSFLSSAGDSHAHRCGCVICRLLGTYTHQQPASCPERHRQTSCRSFEALATDYLPDVVPELQLKPFSLWLHVSTFQTWVSGSNLCMLLQQPSNQRQQRCFRKEE